MDSSTFPCTGKTGLFYPTKRNGRPSADTMKQVIAAQRHCARCEIRERCKYLAFDAGESDGVWGGVFFGDTENIKANFSPLEIKQYYVNRARKVSAKACLTQKYALN
jgi:hypothetical protein